MSAPVYICIHCGEEFSAAEDTGICRGATMSAPCRDIDCTACQLDRCDAEIAACLASANEPAYLVAIGHGDWNAEKALIQTLSASAECLEEEHHSCDREDCKCWCHDREVRDAANA